MNFKTWDPLTYDSTATNAGSCTPTPRYPCVYIVGLQTNCPLGNFSYHHSMNALLHRWWMMCFRLNPSCTSKSADSHRYKRATRKLLYLIGFMVSRFLSDGDQDQLLERKYSPKRSHPSLIDCVSWRSTYTRYFCYLWQCRMPPYNLGLGDSLWQQVLFMHAVYKMLFVYKICIYYLSVSLNWQHCGLALL